MLVCSGKNSHYFSGSDGRSIIEPHVYQHPPFLRYRFVYTRLFFFYVRLSVCSEKNSNHWDNGGDGGNVLEPLMFINTCFVMIGKMRSGINNHSFIEFVTHSPATCLGGGGKEVRKQ